MLNVIRSEWVLLNRTRLWLIGGLAAVGFTATATALTVSTAKPGAHEDAVSIAALTGAGGATAAVIWAIGFGSLLVLCAFAATAGNELTRGTWRTALLRWPDRLTLVTGKLLARLGVTAALLLLAVVVGMGVGAVVAGTNDVSTAGWFGVDGLTAAAGDFGRLLGWTAVLAVLATTIATLVGSTPIALGVLVLWFGPVENVIGEDLSIAPRWFPGHLLRTILSPDRPGSVGQGEAAWTLAAYAAICLVLLAVAARRRDVTS